MKYIISETQLSRLELRRRLSVIDELVEKYLESKTVIRLNFSCKFGVEGMLEMLAHWAAEHLYYVHFSYIDDGSDEWSKIYDMISDYIDEKYIEQVKELYHEICEKD